MMNNKDHMENPNQKSNNIEIHIQGNEPKVFNYQQQGNILNFEFVTDKRIKCPICTNEFKNIMRHLQQSSCGISNMDDFAEKLKQFKNVHLAEQIKEEQRRRKTKSRSRIRQQDIDRLKVLDDQKRWKAKSRVHQRDVDNEKVLADQQK